MEEYIIVLIPVLTKLLISGIRLIQESLPKFAYPLIAPVMGILLDYLVGLGSPEASVGPVIAAIAGGAGVALHEALKQTGVTKKD